MSLYVLKKVEHLQRLGLAGKNAGYGEHGGACPDWLREEQTARRKREASSIRIKSPEPDSLLAVLVRTFAGEPS